MKLADILGQLLGRLVPVLGQGADAGSLCTMVLEAILTLQDPETCLNPMGPALQRVPDETPSPAEVTPLHHLSEECVACHWSLMECLYVASRADNAPCPVLTFCLLHVATGAATHVHATHCATKSSYASP